MKLRPIGIEMKRFDELLKASFDKASSCEGALTDPMMSRSETREIYFLITTHLLEGMYNEIRDKLLDIEQYL